MKYTIVDSRNEGEGGFNFAAIILDNPKFEKCLFAFSDMLFNENGEVSAGVGIVEQNSTGEVIHREDADAMKTADELLGAIVEDFLKNVIGSEKDGIDNAE